LFHVLLKKKILVFTQQVVSQPVDHISAAIDNR